MSHLADLELSSRHYQHWLVGPTYADLARQHGVDLRVLIGRVNMGWTLADALSRPKRGRGVANAALDAGLKTYEGSPCSYCGNTTRIAKNHDCIFRHAHSAMTQAVRSTT